MLIFVVREISYFGCVIVNTSSGEQGFKLHKRLLMAGVRVESAMARHAHMLLRCTTITVYTAYVADRRTANKLC